MPKGGGAATPTNRVKRYERIPRHHSLMVLLYKSSMFAGATQEPGVKAALNLFQFVVFQK